jgi:hypothetical protein
MLAQVFKPTEIEKNGPATRPTIIPARRVAFLFNAGGAPRHEPKAIARQMHRQSMPIESVRPHESRPGAPKRVNLRYSDRHLIRVA